MLYSVPHLTQTGTHAHTKATGSHKQATGLGGIGCVVLVVAAVALQLVGWSFHGAWEARGMGFLVSSEPSNPVPSRLPVLQEDVSLQQMRQLFALGQAALRRARESAKAEALEGPMGKLSALHAEQRALEDGEEARLKVCRGTETDCGIALQICDPLLSPP